MKFLRRGFLVVLLPVVLTGLAQSEMPSFGDEAHRTGRDALYIAASPMRIDATDILPVVLAGGAVAATMAYDRTLWNHLAGLRHWGGEPSLNTAGDILQFGGAIGGVGLLAYGHAAGHSEAFDNGWLELEGFLISGIGVQILKYPIGRERPSGTDPDPHMFKPFSGNDSFPSGHTITAFTAAQIAAEKYDTLWVQVPSYTAATAVAISRAAANKHWASDLLAGGLLGLGVGHGLVKVHDRPAADWRLTASSDSLLLTFSWNLPT